MKHCCVPGCRDNVSRRFTFPSDKRLRDIWLQRIGNLKLLNYEVKHLQKNFPVCQSHFAEMCINPSSGRLLRYSLPTIKLPGFSELSTHAISFSYPRECAYNITPEKIRDALQSLPSSSAYTPEKWVVKTPKKTYTSHSGQTRQTRAALFTGDKLDNSKAASESAEVLEGSVAVGVQPLSPLHDEAQHTQYQCESLPSTSGYPEMRKAADSLAPKKANRKKSLLRAVGVTREKHLTPTARYLYKKANCLQQVAAKLRKKHISDKQKLKSLSTNVGFLNSLKNINEVTAKFFLSQIRTQKFKPRGRRFTIDDKILALSVYKQSGRAYKFLSTIFSFPSRKILRQMLNKIPFHAGVNESVFTHLKQRVSKLKAIDKYCVVMFDEIALSPGLQYNARTDSVEGFVDSGGANRRPAFADHALAFIVKGLHKRWKQTVCFTFCEGTTPTSELVNILKQVIVQLQNCGLHIVTTISDQGATNQAAIKQLLSETSDHFHRQNEENRLQGYLINDTEIVHLFDFPHLMKCVRNMLLYKDLIFVQDGKEKIASWSHIVKIYEMDKTRGVYSQFSKLTDEHVVPSKIKKMRVKNCTQVFSHTVASAMNSAA